MNSLENSLYSFLFFFFFLLECGRSILKVYWEVMWCEVFVFSLYKFLPGSFVISSLTLQRCTSRTWSFLSTAVGIMLLLVDYLAPVRLWALSPLAKSVTVHPSAFHLSTFCWYCSPAIISASILCFSSVLFLLLYCYLSGAWKRMDIHTGFARTNLNQYTLTIPNQWHVTMWTMSSFQKHILVGF